MVKYGILVDYDWCSGCHSCEVACQVEHGFSPLQGGIHVMTVGPWEVSDSVWVYDHVVSFTNQCDACAERVDMGKEPTCVKHCQARCLEFGLYEELAAKGADHRKQALFSL